MSRVTVEVRNAHDVHVTIPSWLFKTIGFLMAVWVLFLAALFLLAGQPLPAIVTASIGLAFIPLSLVLTYIYWRFFWWLTAALLFCSTATTMPPLIWMLFTGKLRAVPPASFTLPSTLPVENILVFVGAVLVLAVMLLIARRITASRSESDGGGGGDETDFEFDEPEPVEQTFQERVAALLTRKTGAKTAIEGDVIRVYKGRSLAGIVKCIDRPGKAISPVMVRDARKTVERIGAETVYLATSGFFPNDARAEADRLSVKVIELT